MADHRRHHAFTDKEGDPHSPWLFGTSPIAVAKGFVHAHLSWLFVRDKTNAARFAPDLLADGDLRRVHRQFIGWSLVSLAAPALLGGVITWSWYDRYAARSPQTHRIDRATVHDCASPGRPRVCLKR